MITFYLAIAIFGLCRFAEIWVDAVPTSVANRRRLAETVDVIDIFATLYLIGAVVAVAAFYVLAFFGLLSA